MRKPNFVALAALILISMPAAAQSRTVDLGKPEGILSTIASVLSRHPRILADQVSFKQDVTKILEGAHVLATDLHLSPERFQIQDQYPGLSMRLEGGITSFQKEKVEALRADLLKTRADLIKAIPDWQPQSVPDTLKNEKLNRDPKLAQKILKLLPWYNDSAGALIKGELETVLKSADGAKMSAVYQDVFKYHLQQKIREASGFWNQAADVYIKQFIEKTVQTALVLKSQSGGATANVSIELIPPVVALLRGPIGYDCSILSVPFFPILPDTHVFWIRRSTELGGPPAGYMLVTMVQYHGEKYPYVVTVNGQTLTALDTRAALVLAAKYFKVDEVVLPDLEKNPAVVNDEIKKEGMIGEESVAVTFPKIWSELDNHPHSQLQSGYSKYYSASKLEYARVTRIRSGESAQFVSTRKDLKSLNPYPERDVSQMDVFDRAVLAGNLGHASQDVYLRLLDLTEAQMKAGQRVMNLTGDESLSRDEFIELASVLKVPEEFLAARLPLISRALTLPKLADREWALGVAKKTAAALDVQLKEDADRDFQYGVRMLRPIRAALDIFAAYGGFLTEKQAFDKAIPGFVKRLEFGYETLDKAPLSEIEPRLHELMPADAAILSFMLMMAKGPSDGIFAIVNTLLVHPDPELRGLGFKVFRDRRNAVSGAFYPLKNLLDEPADSINSNLKLPGAEAILIRNGDFSSAEALSTFMTVDRSKKKLLAMAYGERYSQDHQDKRVKSNPLLEEAIMKFLEHDAKANAGVFEYWFLSVLPALQPGFSDRIWELYRPGFDRLMKIEPDFLSGLPYYNTRWPEWFHAKAAAMLLEGEHNMRIFVKDQPAWSPEIWQAVETILGREAGRYSNHALGMLESRKEWPRSVWQKILAMSEAAKGPYDQSRAQLIELFAGRKLPREFLPILKAWRANIVPAGNGNYSSSERSNKEILDKLIRGTKFRICDEDLLGTGKRRWFFQ